MARGTLRIYLGAAPGVGKTYSMLNEGRRAMERGTDVVVGFVETHGRPHTAAQVDGLEVIPRKTLGYRGTTFEEMDVDAILARHPQRALVDELAHTNVPGSRNAKRWQDIEELLGAGIDVISTVNIQHFESLNDVVEQITGVKQRETVPDAVVRAADQLELEDMTPEALRRRMAHGNIYAPEKVDAAIGNYFRVGNLAALRELALLWMADRVDENLQDYRDRHGIAGRWETKERVLVTLTGAPNGEHLIRRAARMAMRTRGELIGVHVTPDDGLSAPPGDRLSSHRALLEGLGGGYREVMGSDIASALVQVAQAENATQIVLGASRRSRWSELARGSVINRVVRAAGGSIDIHVISNVDDPAGEADDLRSPPRLRLAPMSRRRHEVAFGLTIVGLPLLTFALSLMRSTLGLQNALLCYLLFVVAIATIGGTWPAVVASVGGFLLLNWFFAPPIHTLTIDNGRDVLALVAFLVVGAVISALVDLAARRSRDAIRARAEARALSSMASTALRDADPLPTLLDMLVVDFRLRGAAMLSPAGDGWEVEASAGEQRPHTPDAATLTVPIADGAVLAIVSDGVRAEEQELLAGFATQLALARQGRRLAAEAAGASALAKANELRTALLAAVSHDLRTPLASIRAAATGLLSSDVHYEPDTSKELLETIDEEAERLNKLVGNLLDMSRLQTGALSLDLQPVGLEELVAAAAVGLPYARARLEIDVPETLPHVLVDPALTERALANLMANALAFSPPESVVRVEAGAVGDRVDLRLVDVGPGIAAKDRERVFQPFQRLGDQPNGNGVGLGMAVAKGFIEAVGGELTIEDTPGGGTTMVVSLPVSR